MAVLANIGGLHVGWAFTSSSGAIVATDAIAGHVGVIEVGRNPTIGGVAVIASVLACNMIWCFPRRNGTVVAAKTGTDHLAVVNPQGW